MHNPFSSFRIQPLEMTSQAQGWSNQGPEDILLTGNLLVEVSKSINRSLGTILFIEYYLASLNLTLSCYFDCTIYSLFDKYYHAVLSFILTNLVLTVMALVRIFHLALAGQSICGAMDRAKDSLQKYQVSINFSAPIKVCELHEMIAIIRASSEHCISSYNSCRAFQACTNYVGMKLCPLCIDK